MLIQCDSALGEIDASVKGQPEEFVVCMLVCEYVSMLVVGGDTAQNNHEAAGSSCLAAVVQESQKMVMMIS